MAIHKLMAVAPGQAKTAFYLSTTRVLAPPEPGKERVYGKKLHYHIFLCRNGRAPPHKRFAPSGAVELPDVEINGGREEALRAALLAYHYDHQLSTVEYSITLDGKAALEPNYHRRQNSVNDLVRIDAKLLVLHDLKEMGVKRVQPYRGHPEITWSISRAIRETASGASPRIFGRMPIAEGPQ
jgi:hypothetical protein